MSLNENLKTRRTQLAILASLMRNGMIVGYAGAAGLLSGFGEGIKSAATPSVGLGATADVGSQQTPVSTRHRPYINT